MVSKLWEIWNCVADSVMSVTALEGIRCGKSFEFGNMDQYHLLSIFPTTYIQASPLEHILPSQNSFKYRSNGILNYQKDCTHSI